MANIIWPPALPQRSLKSPWQAQQPAARWTFEGDEGPAMSRPKGPRGKKLSMEFLMTRQQWAIFQNFHEQGLNNGVLPFEYLDPDSGRVLEVRFDPAAETDFTGKAKGARHRSVSMTWEVLL